MSHWANADPHVGHMHSMVVADVIKRFREICGETAILSTGTDEHGMKVPSIFTCVYIRYKKRHQQLGRILWSFVLPQLKSSRFRICSWELIVGLGYTDEYE